MLAKRLPDYNPIWRDGPSEFSSIVLFTFFPDVTNYPGDVSAECVIHVKSSMCSETQSIYGIYTTDCSLGRIWSFSKVICRKVIGGKQIQSVTRVTAVCRGSDLNNRNMLLYSTKWYATLHNNHHMRCTIVHYPCPLYLYHKCFAVRCTLMIFLYRACAETLTVSSNLSSTPLLHHKLQLLQFTYVQYLCQQLCSTADNANLCRSG